MTGKRNNKTAREWLISFACSKMRLYRVSAHIALEEVYAESRSAQDGSLIKFAANAYGKCDLERLIAAVERK